MQRLFFLHIQKTAGSSLLRSVLEPNMSLRLVGPLDQEIYRRLKDLPEADCLHGHVPYGYHRFMKDDFTYVTMLRDPVDRAISYYYFIRGTVRRLDLVERHPLHDYFHSVSLAEVFANPKFSNTQTRRLAGIEFDRAYPYVGRSEKFRRTMLAAAKEHLAAMPVFGLKEQFEESQRRLLQFVGGDSCLSGIRENATAERPSIEDIRKFRPVVLDRLRAANDLDYELYEFATEAFERASAASAVRA